MTMDRYCKWGPALLFAALFPNAAHAQTVAGSFDELRRILAVDETVVVTENIGRQIRGKVVDVSADALTIRTGDRQVFMESTVAEVRRIDSLRNGLLMGAGIGGAVLALGIYDCAAGSGRGTCGAPIEDGALA